MTNAERRAPTASYRLQLQPGFGFAEAAAAVPYLAGLGVSHLHLSPVLQAVPGSRHGYDVVDHERISAELGGEAGLRALAERARAHDLGLLADIVPNHMAAPTPLHLNRTLWRALREGPESPAAAWFDIDWAAQDGRVLLPVLGERIGAVLADGGFRLAANEGPDGDETVLRYGPHAFPLRPGTETLPLPELLRRQFYRPAWWRLGGTELNYRRFFTVNELIAVRVERPEVFEATHALLLRLYAEGVLDGFRVDHPDGLADPRGYLRRLREATGGAHVVVEKILTGQETLPDDWPCAGTTGYDALRQIDGVLTDGDGVVRGLRPAAATAVAAALRGRSELVRPQGELDAEVARLVREVQAACGDDLARTDHPAWAIRAAVAGLLARFPRYRPYPVPGEPLPDADVAALRAEPDEGLLPAPHAGTAALLKQLLLAADSPASLRARFSQTCAAVAAKGVEDTAFYRNHPLLSLNEVGGDPAHPGVSPQEFHAYCARIARDWPTTMTALSTHDTKRSADARARLAVLAELPQEWLAERDAWSALAPGGGLPQDRAAEDLVFQTALAAWPIDGERLAAVALKSVREAKLHTSWTDPDPAYEDAVRALALSIPADPALAARITAFADRIAPHARVNTLGAALLQLTMPGAPDLYQGSEFPLYTLVDPDNRGVVAFPEESGPTGLAAEKASLTRTALRLRADLDPKAGYAPWPTPGPHALAFLRGDAALTVVTRLPHGLARSGGWRDATLTLPEGSWTETLSGRTGFTGTVALAELLDPLPVALLARE
ncbi:malto-oligosyltrehalose synthase [Streptacidiphilus pinicola]|uniref:Malto-oligosyltrehalose synthase n=1 Tax=Streptacidiphilus pinicola TaxID=2219663 RepID=A0A2X0J2M3_9ACTN|nr:malto-oligosyltrehalose synthase [Streptacidiphilus pinicola]RAG84456.1 malto-oligosyltrehalose synthase [Streptacidiphilus pinicola]